MADGRTDGRTDMWRTDGRTDMWRTGGRTDGRICDGWTDGRITRFASKCHLRVIYGLKCANYAFKSHIHVLPKRMKYGYGLKYANHAFKSHIRISIKIEYGKCFI